MNYQNLLFCENNINSEKVLNITFTKDPKMPKSDYKLDIIFEKRIHILF